MISQTGIEFFCSPSRPPIHFQGRVEALQLSLAFSLQKRPCIFWQVEESLLHHLRLHDELLISFDLAVANRSEQLQNRNRKLRIPLHVAFKLNSD